MSARRTYSPKGCFCSTSPPVAVAGKLIIGGAVNDNYTAMAQSGVIRAFDIDTGQLLWNWDSGNPDRTEPIDIAGGETYTTNSPNSWSVFSADEELGLVYLPLGNQSPDQLGMGRSANVERFSSSVVALDIATGKLRWAFRALAGRSSPRAGWCSWQQPWTIICVPMSWRRAGRCGAHAFPRAASQRP